MNKRRRRNNLKTMDRRLRLLMLKALEMTAERTRGSTAVNQRPASIVLQYRKIQTKLS